MQWLFIAGSAAPPFEKATGIDANRETERTIDGGAALAFASPHRPSIES